MWNWWLIFACKERAIDHLVLSCKDGILNTAEIATVVDKNVTYKNNNCLIQNNYFLQLFISNEFINDILW